MFAPIFTWELRRTVPRRWFRSVRILYALIILCFFLWPFFPTDTDHQSSVRMFLRQTREYGYFLMVAHCSAIFLLTPILAAGPILQEKKRRTLELLLITRQRSADIVLGHWLAALVKLLIFTSPGVPLLLWTHAMLGTAWWAIAAWIGCTWLLALPLSAWSLFVAIEERNELLAIFKCYLGSAIFFLSLLLVFSNPQIFMSGKPRLSLSGRSADYDGLFWLEFALFIGVPTLFCLSLAIRILRGAYFVRHEPSAYNRIPGHRPPVSDEPIFWKQYYLHQAYTLRFLPFWCRIGLVIALSSGLALVPDPKRMMTFFAGIFLLFGFPLAALLWSCSIIITEREASTWDSLRMAPLRAKELVDQILSAIEKRIRLYWYAMFFAVMILLVKDWRSGIIILSCWLLGRINVRHAANAGIHSSVQMRSYLASVLNAGMKICGLTYAIVGVAIWLPLMLVMAIAFGVVGACLRYFGVDPVFGGGFIAKTTLEIVVGIFAIGSFLASMQWMYSKNSRTLYGFTIQHLIEREGFEES
jgi:hypothetical protein